MNVLKRSAPMRWALAWVVTSLILTAFVQYQVVVAGASSALGKTAITQFTTILILAAPWFLWGEILTRYIRNFSTYAAWRKIIAGVLLLLLFAALLGMVFLALFTSAELGY